MKVKIKNTSANELPAYQTAGAAGVDLRANLPEGGIRLAPLERTLVPTGLYLEIPDGMRRRCVRAVVYLSSTVSRLSMHQVL